MKTRQPFKTPLQSERKIIPPKQKPLHRAYKSKGPNTLPPAPAPAAAAPAAIARRLF